MSFWSSRRQRIVHGVVLLLGLAMMPGCSHPLPTPPTVAHEGEEPIVVPYPPPAAKVDIVQLAPDGMKHAVWIDGQWMWRGRRWIWEAGQWVDLGPDQVYALPFVQRRYDGQLVWFPGSLRSKTTASASSSAGSAPSSTAPAPSTTAPSTTAPPPSPPAAPSLSVSPSPSPPPTSSATP